MRTIALRLVAIALAFVCIGPLFCGDPASAKDKNDSAVRYNLYFGDLHTHTSYSDAWEGTPWDAYQAAIDAGADYMAVTDHVSIWNAYSGLTMDSEEWTDTLAAADYYTSKKFVAMAGYEAWLLGRLGEINVYNVRELPPEEPLGYRFDRLPNFYDWLASQGAIGQFNHPYYMTDDFESYSYYTETRDSAMNIIEVWNTEFTEDSYIMALDTGWHVMPSANSDTHNPDWIAGHEMRTVLLAESLTADNLYAAMNGCRGYATLDKNLRISYTLNDQVMGSVLTADSSAYTASIHIEDPDGVASDAITLVEIISDGGVVVASMPGGSTVFDWEVSFESDSSHYYYVRVTTASALSGGEGITAWTAPVWTGR
ncbi:MAG TPA: CehA/McbA family metallohydrolase [Thermoplasmata archaeon]